MARELCKSGQQLVISWIARSVYRLQTRGAIHVHGGGNCLKRALSDWTDLKHKWAIHANIEVAIPMFDSHRGRKGTKRFAVLDL